VSEWQLFCVGGALAAKLPLKLRDERATSVSAAESRLKKAGLEPGFDQPVRPLSFSPPVR
jgi:hypothetical protein